MLSRWTSHLKTEEEKQLFRNSIKSAKSVLDRLKDIIDDDLDGVNRSQMNPKSYDQASWAYHQAHKNGINQYATQVKTLIDLDQQKDTNTNG